MNALGPDLFENNTHSKIPLPNDAAGQSQSIFRDQQGEHFGAANYLSEFRKLQSCASAGDVANHAVIFVSTVVDRRRLVNVEAMCNTILNHGCALRKLAIPL